MAEEQFNIFTASEELKIPKEIYLRIVVKAIEQTEKDLLVLRSAHERNDIETVQAISHRLKGDYANLRVTILSVIAAQLNVLAKGNYDCDQALNLIAEFSKAFEDFKRVINDPV